MKPSMRIAAAFLTLLVTQAVFTGCSNLNLRSTGSAQPSDSRAEYVYDASSGGYHWERDGRRVNSEYER